MCHPVCMADESGLGLVMLRSWEMFLEVSTRPMQAPGVPAEHRSPAGSHSFCSKGTRIMLVTKVVFLVLSKCGADRSLCFHSPCPDVLQDLCTEIPSALEEKGDVNTWTAAFWLPAIGHDGPAWAAGEQNILLKPEHLVIHPCCCGIFSRSQGFNLLSCSFTRSFAEQTGLKDYRNMLQNSRRKMLSRAIK